MPNSRGQNARRIVRQNVALAARLMGKSYRDIAMECGGVDVKTAYTDVQDALASLTEISSDRAEAVRTIELLRLDALQLCLAPRIEEGNTRAVLAAVKIMERRAKLLSLDEPEAAETRPFKFTLDIGTLGGEATEDDQ